MARIVLATYGSLGDLHPALALALGLRERGHRVIVATSGMYREKVSALGLGFHSLRPDLLAQGEHIIADIMDGPRGSERLMRDHLFPAVRQMHADLLPLVSDADVLIASELVFPASIFAATHGLRWISYQLAPVSLFSLHDPPVLPAPDAVRWLQRGGWLHRPVRVLGKLISHPWWRPIREFRAELGLPPGGHPLFEGKYSPLLNLALFSRVLGPPQPDWPSKTVQPGFLFHDEARDYAALPPAVAEFLAAGEPPIVFTLGSAAVYVPGDFYAESARAAQTLGRRALLLLGKNPPPPNLPPSILAWDYLPFAQIFPHAAALVHQGGVGTTAQALRAGRPMLVVPFAHDQFDNAARVCRLGVGRELSRARYTGPRVARELAALLRNPSTITQAGHLSAEIRAEQSLPTACTAIERVLP
ncbi:MAG: glycosyltransferase [Verrucomicrobiota bacterium]